MLRASTSYDARCAYGQINISAGEVVMEVKADKGGWTVVKHQDGRHGALPSQILGDMHFIVTLHILAVADTAKPVAKTWRAVSAHDANGAYYVNGFNLWKSNGAYGQVSLTAGELVEEVRLDQGG